MTPSYCVSFPFQLDVYIETHLNGFVLDIEESNQENGAKVISYPRNSPPSRNQQWYLDYQPDRTFLIVSRLNGKVLDCVGQIKDEQLIVWDRHGGENQRFKREGYYLVTMRGLVVDVKRSNQAPKTPIIQYSKNSPASSNQHFSIKSVSVQSGLCLLWPQLSNIQRYINAEDEIICTVIAKTNTDPQSLFD